jgi:uncharacterized RDD family membrane protein YckC
MIYDNEDALDNFCPSACIILRVYCVWGQRWLFHEDRLYIHVLVFLILALFHTIQRPQTQYAHDNAQMDKNCQVRLRFRTSVFAQTP